MARKSEQTKARIIAAASLLFWKRSYRAVNVALISDTAEVNKATLYQYFASKEALALAVIEDNFQRTRDYIFEGSFAVSDDPGRRIEEIYRRVFETAKAARADGASPGCPFVNIGAEMDREPRDQKSGQQDLLAVRRLLPPHRPRRRAGERGPEQARRGQGRARADRHHEWGHDGLEDREPARGHPRGNRHGPIDPRGQMIWNGGSSSAHLPDY